MQAKTLLRTALAASMLCGLALTALAADSSKATKSSTVGHNAPVSGPPTLVFNRTLRSTSFSFGDADITIPGGTETAIDSPLKFTCQFATCTVTVEMHVQFGGNTISDNDSALCAHLDGVDMPPPGGGGGCPYTGEILTDGRYQEASFSFTQNGVTKGSHTMEGFAWADDGATVGNYTIIYRLYTP